MIEPLLAKARAAMEQVKDYNQEQIDNVVKVIGKVVYDHAEELGIEAVAETNYGNVPEKTFKNSYFSRALYQHLKGKPSIGILETNEAEGIIKIAHPVGVVGSVTPVTVPNICPMGNSMLALKGRNAIIISPHPKSTRSSGHTVALMREALTKIGAPADLIQVVPNPSIEASAEVMANCDVCIATGGPSMVKAAYSSGKPAFSAGAGNPQMIVDHVDNFEEFANETIYSRQYDNGTACVCAQAMIYRETLEEKIFKALSDKNAYVVRDPDIVEKYRRTMFVNGAFNKEIAGRSALFVSEAAGVNVPKETSIIVLKVSKYGADDVMAYEKVCPVMLAYPVKNVDEALKIALANLNVQGKGHTCGLYSNDRETVVKVARTLPVCRLMVNQPTADSGSGPHNSLNPSNSLCCGSWGNNSISENLTYMHLLNVQRVALRIERELPDLEHIWE
jgi:succinate-semialdehyde dehydrogenase